MEAISLSCPNCGAALVDPAENGQYLCAYCHHRSTAPNTPNTHVAPAQEAAMLAEVVHELEALEVPPTRGESTYSERHRKATAAKTRQSGYLLLGVGSLFLLFSAACVVGAVVVLLDDGPQSPGSLLAFGLFWLVFGGVMLRGGVRYMRSARGERRV
jgi:hypothetical protein